MPRRKFIWESHPHCGLSICVSVCTPGAPHFFSTRPSDCNQICGLIRESFEPKQNWPTPGGSRGVGKFKRPGKFHELPRKSILFLGSFRGQNFKVTWSIKFKKVSRECSYPERLHKYSGWSRVIRGWREGGVGGGGKGKGRRRQGGRGPSEAG